MYLLGDGSDQDLWVFDKGVSSQEKLWPQGWWPCTPPGWTAGWQRDRDGTASKERAVGCSGNGHVTWTDLSLGRKKQRATQLHLQFSLVAQGPRLFSEPLESLQDRAAGRAELL